LTFIKTEGILVYQQYSLFKTTNIARREDNSPVTDLTRPKYALSIKTYSSIAFNRRFYLPFVGHNAYVYAQP
jgi:hypothetical protein